ncbi:MAG: serine hydrolase [Planctomycetota bacterium]|nr:serine hydrolase [Planctomycetota bacterium]
MRTLLATFVGIAAVVNPAQGQPVYDFSGVTALAEGALAGQNVNVPVPGFELLLMKDGQVVYRRAFGAWSLDEVAAADSSTKTLSGALVMSLTESSDRPFSLSSRVSEFIPQFTGLKQFITIRQCFSHTAGTGQNGAEGNPGVTLQEAALLIAAAPLSYVPGTAFSYGGTSMHAAGAAAELAGGQPWNTLFAQRITGPLGLTRTRFVLTTPDNPRIAGGCESTALEFATFMEMLRRGGLHAGPGGDVRVLQQASVDAMFTRQTPPDVPVLSSPYTGDGDYGVGVWLDERTPDGTLRGALAAGARGFSSWIDFDDGMVGAFATDRTQSSNIRTLVNLIRDAAAAAVRAGCDPDVNADGSADQDDVACLALAVAGESSCLGMGADPDFNRDGNVDQDDVDALAQVVAGSGCP